MTSAMKGGEDTVDEDAMEVRFHKRVSVTDDAVMRSLITHSNCLHDTEDLTERRES